MPRRKRPIEPLSLQILLQKSRRKVARVFVALPEKSREVAGFYALSAGSIERATLPPDDVRRLPRYPVPVALIGRLAVDRRWAGQGLGSALLADAFRRVVRASESLAVYAVVVDAKDEQARAFYERFGFIRLPDEGKTPVLSFDRDRTVNW